MISNLELNGTFEPSLWFPLCQVVGKVLQHQLDDEES